MSAAALQDTSGQSSTGITSLVSSTLQGENIKSSGIPGTSVLDDSRPSLSINHSASSFLNIPSGQSTRSNSSLALHSPPADDAEAAKRVSPTASSPSESESKIRKRLSGRNSLFAQPGRETRSEGGISPQDNQHHRAGRTKSSASQSSSQLEKKRTLRRSPATNCSNGIETSYGPPPALLTSRRNGYTDLARLSQSPAAATLATQQQKPYNRGAVSSHDIAANSEPTANDKSSHKTYHTVHGLLSPATGHTSDMESLDAMLSRGRSNWHGAPSTGVNASPVHAMTPGRAQISDEGMESSSSEDQFLKLANDSDSADRRESPRLEAHDRNASGAPVAAQDLDYFHRPSRESAAMESDALSRYVSQSNRSGYRSGAASVVGLPTRSQTFLSPEQKVGSYRAQYNGLQSARPPSRTGMSTPVGQRRASASEHLLARFHQQRQSRQSHNSPTTSEFSPKARSQFQRDSRADGESVVSTVHSNVWDEMQELKSHLNRLENSRGWASGGAHSNGSGERPRTATTTVTTMSSSPKVNTGFKSALTDSKFAHEIAQMHPNLHQSLSRCKAIVSPAVYRALDSAATEALEMAASSRGTTNGSIVGSSIGYSGDRQVRRKADNICRSLTDLCVALIDAHPASEAPERSSTSPYSPQRQNYEISTPKSRLAADTLVYGRADQQQDATAEDAQQPASRALDRVQARRTSLLHNGTPASSPREGPEARTQATPDDSRASPNAVNDNRSGTALMRHRAQQQHQRDSEPFAVRAPSRAATEIGTHSRSPMDRISAIRNKIRLNNSSHLSLTPNQPNPSATRRVTTGQPSPSTPSSSMSFLRSASRNLTHDRLATNDASSADEKKVKRRSFNLYQLPHTPGPPQRSLSLRPASISSKATSVTADS